MQIQRQQSITKLILSGDTSPPQSPISHTNSIIQSRERPDCIIKRLSEQYKHSEHKHIPVQAYTDSLIMWNYYLIHKFSKSEKSISAIGDEQLTQQKTSEN